jgi:hypothetical protein
LSGVGVASNPHGIAHPKKRAFLTSYAVAGNITLACEAAGIGRRTYYDWTEHDQEFSAALGLAREEAADRLEDAARQRAVAGVVKETPIYHDGHLIDTVVETKYSDTLLIFLLKGVRPEKYRERLDVQHTGEPPTKVYGGFDPSRA